MRLKMTKTTTRTSFWFTFVWCLLIQRVIGEEPVLINQDEPSLRSFADSLTKEIYTNDNDCSSTWGVSMMLDLLRPGSGSAADTLLQLCDVVGLCGPELELLWNDTVKGLTSRYDGSCSFAYEGECLEFLPTVRVANSVWIDTASVLDAVYEEVVGEYLQRTDFNSDMAGGVVNEWVNASTLGLIDSIIPEGTIDFSLLAVNSIYFKAAWGTPFPAWNTNMDLFYTNSTATGKEAHFMHLVDYFRYSDTDLAGYQVVQLPYLNSNMSMIITLPLADSAVDDVNVSSESVVAVLPKLNVTRVAIALPKFQFESEYGESLLGALKAVGLTAPFVQGFCALFEGTCQFLDFVKQKTYIEVNEEGTIAAAVTAGGVVTSLPVDTPVEFLADHPFRFFIYDGTDDLILFEGRVGLPAIPEDSMAQLEAKHSDDDFWPSYFGVEPTVPEPVSTEQTKNTETSTEQTTESSSEETTESPTEDTKTIMDSSQVGSASSGTSNWHVRFVYTAVAALFVAMLLI